MMYSTTNAYAMKREILGFSEKLSAGLHRPDRKLAADMLYGLLASGSCLLTDMADQLHEKGRVRKLKAINALNFYITAAMA